MVDNTGSSGWLMTKVKDYCNTVSDYIPNVIKEVSMASLVNPYTPYRRDIPGFSQQTALQLYELSEETKPPEEHELKIHRDEEKEGMMVEQGNHPCDCYKETIMSFISSKNVQYKHDFKHIRLSSILPILKECVEGEKEWRYAIITIYNNAVKAENNVQLMKDLDNEICGKQNRDDRDDFIIGSLRLTYLIVNFIETYVPDKTSVIETFQIDGDINPLSWGNRYSVYNKESCNFIISNLKQIIVDQISDPDELDEIMFYFDELKVNIENLINKMSNNPMIDSFTASPLLLDERKEK